MTISWDDYKGQTNAVKYMQNCISNNRFPSAILITGPPGVGKSLLTELSIRSVLCAGKSNKPCGECEYCLSNIREMDNVKWHQVASLDGMSDMLYDINLWAKEAPLYLNGVGFTRKFVVLDEIQLLTSSHIQSLLGYIDITPKTTTWILISMDLSKLSNTILDALSSRCKEIELNSHTIKDCIDYVMDNWSLTYKDAKLLASLSDGNLRKISSLVEYCNTIDESKNIGQILLGNANNRLDLWHSLYNKNYKAAINICNEWLRQCNSNVLIKLLIDDLIEQISKIPSDNLIHDLDLLIKYSSGSIKVSLSNYISLLKGFKQEEERQFIIITKDIKSFTSIKSLEDYYLEYCIY